MIESDRTSLMPLALVLVLGLALVAVSPGQAQTPAATVEDDQGNIVLQSFTQGQLLAPGSFSNVAIPKEGSGTRLMWYPGEAAFRAGQVGTQWNDANVGTYSVAFGENTEASGDYSAAMGGGTTASGDWATAMGENTTAATDQSLTIGAYNSANTSAGNFLLVAGNGSGSNSRSDALVLDKDGNLEISGTLTQNSDRRLKSSVEPIGEEILGRLAELRPVRFEFKDPDTHPSGEQLGLIAQDVQAEFPELVSEGAGGMLSLSYSKLTAVLLKGIQEQQTQIEGQQATIDSLKQQVRQIESVKKRLAVLEAQEQPATAGWTGALPLRSLALLFAGVVLGAGLLHFRRQ
jgi:hypothetical protein